MLTDIESGNIIPAVNVMMPTQYIYNECKNYKYVYHYGDKDYCLSLYNKIMFINRHGSSVTVEIDPDSPECFKATPHKTRLTAVAVFMLKYGLSGLFEYC